MLPPRGASVWERALFDHLVDHVQREWESLKDYAEAAARTDSRAFAYIVGLLAEDERRHHALFADLAASLKTEAELRDSAPAIPHMDFDKANAAEIRELTLSLLKNEEQDAKDLKRLHEQLQEVKHTTLWDLLVSLMRRDTDKHIAMLEFVLQHTSSGGVRWPVIRR